MHRARALLLITVLTFCGVTASNADSVTAYFNLIPTGYGTHIVTAPQGQITFTLSGDGTIAADLVDYYGSIKFFAFASPTDNLAISGLTPNPLYYSFSGGGPFGEQHSGITCETSGCGSSESWVIGNPGQFTSVWEALNGPGSFVNFVLEDSTPAADYASLWGAGARASTTPEPGTLLMFGTGALGMLGAFRRRFSL